MNNGRAFDLFKLLTFFGIDKMKKNWGLEFEESIFAKYSDDCSTFQRFGAVMFRNTSANLRIILKDHSIMTFVHIVSISSRISKPLFSSNIVDWLLYIYTLGLSGPIEHWVLRFIIVLWLSWINPSRVTMQKWFSFTSLEQQSFLTFPIPPFFDLSLSLYGSNFHEYWMFQYKIALTTLLLRPI